MASGGSGGATRTSARAGRGVDPLDCPAHLYALAWLALVSFAALGLAIAADLGLLDLLFGLDRSRVTWMIAALVAAGTLHASWHVVKASRRIEAARAALERGVRHRGEGERDDGGRDRAGDGAPARFVAAWLEASGEAAPDELLDIWADRLRSPVDTGWFLVDTTVRLGLLGTIVGFILIFTSLGDVSIDGAEGLRELLVAMSGGMGTALFTTLAGLVGATLLAVQYLVLGRGTEHLLGMLARCRHRPPPRG